MIPVNRDTLMMIATIACAIGIIFLFKEMNKAKKDFQSFSEQVVKHLTPTPEPVPAPAPAPVKRVAPEPEPKEEE
jgi:hypothetical protein